MGNVTAIPEGKLEHVSAEEREEFETFRSGADNDYFAGITGVKNAYDPTAGSKYPKTPVPHREQPEASLGTDKRDRNEPVKVISRERNSAVDKSEQSVVRSGRKANDAK